MKKSILIILSIFVFFTSCASTSTKNNVSQNSSVSASLDYLETKPTKNSYKGKDLVLAVTPPVLNNDSKSNSWIPQYFQDSLTGKFAQFSKMTVLDRKNELLIKAEQELSESGYYSEENALQIGQMTNAQLVVVGNIQQISGNYEVNFRVNDATTNEIKASSSNRYSLSDLQSGKAVNETTQNLLEGLGIELSASEKLALSKVNKIENQSTMNLAKGNAAEKSDDFINALLSYSQIEGNLKKEADSNIQTIFNGNVDTTSVQSKLAYYSSQKEKWNKIFRQLEDYMNDNVGFVVYDFSKVEDEINMRKNTVNFVVTPGVKCVPNMTAMKLFSIVENEWNLVKSDRNNDVWSGTVDLPFIGGKSLASASMSHIFYSFSIVVGLFDNDGNLIQQINTRPVINGWVRSGNGYDFFDRLGSTLSSSRIVAKSQEKYFDNEKYKEIKFSSIKFDEIKNDFNIKIISAEMEVYTRNGRTSTFNRKTPPVYSIDEYNDWVKNQ